MTSKEVTRDESGLALVGGKTRLRLAGFLGEAWAWTRFSADRGLLLRHEARQNIGDSTD